MRPLAKRLRRDQTDTEAILWSRLRDRRLGGWKFKRQYRIAPYIVDFICVERRLVVEIDGSQHIDRFELDAERDRVLNSHGFRVMRIWNSEIISNLPGVCETILAELGGEAPSPQPPLPIRGEGEVG